MNKPKLMFAVFAACVALAACAKKDFNAITGTDTSTGVTLSSDPASFDVHVRLVPREIDTVSGVIDTIPAHEVPADSTAFNPVATLEPQDVVIANGQDNMVFTFNNSVASLNGSQFVQGDTTGTSSLTITYTDVVHGFATTTLTLPVTVTQVP